jgi:ureidoglycolate hydrolase
MVISEKLLEIRDYHGEGYLPLIDFGAWRVAVLRALPQLLDPRLLDQMERHNETDEVFVLLAGACTLLLGTGDAEIKEIVAVKMEPLKLYNIKRAVWHTVMLTQDATVLIVENQDTTRDNSSYLTLTPAQREQLVAAAQG